MYLGYLISWLHPVLVHFPIALLLIAVAAEGIGWLGRRPVFSTAAKGLLMAGCVISLFAFVSGNFAEVFAVRGGTPHDPVDRHAIWAMITTWCYILLTIARFYLRPEMRGFVVYFAGLLAASGLLIFTAHQGGELVYTHGANVLEVHGGHALDMKDLRDLYQEQDEVSIVYSEMMHHIFGWLVLALGLFLIASRLWPEATRRLWRGGPFVLLAGGVFLMIFSDTDSWPLSNVRPVYDKEVLQHKIFATLMILAGGLGIARRNKAGSATTSDHHLALALLALVGGGLLFTHVHSVAPYSNRAIGVYLHHLTMGFIALSIGGVSLWEAVKPQGPGFRAFLWPVLLLVESVFLIKYNEDIPWFARPFNDQPVAFESTAFDLEVNSEPVCPVAGKPCRLRFEVRDRATRGPVRDLEVMHEYPLHLMIVSRDLSLFDHIHPVLQKDGSLLLDYTFPHGGEFVLFANAVPKGAATQSFRHAVMVEGPVPPPTKLAENAYATVSAGKRQVMLFTKPLIPTPGQPVYLRFVLTQDDRGLSDVEPWLGCFGHCVIISEDTSFYEHTHPSDHKHDAAAQTAAAASSDPVMNAKDNLPQLGDTRKMMYAMGMSTPSMRFAGPEVTFLATFPKSGLYKVWGQFKHQGEVVTVSFVVSVP